MKFGKSKNRVTKTIKRIFRSNLSRDIEYMKNEGLDEKTELIYQRIKALFSGSWNLIIDKIVNLLIRSAMKDARTLIDYARGIGENEMAFLPNNLKDKVAYYAK